LSKDWFGETPTNTVIQWHFDTFSIPTGATLVASSDSCTNQAFAIGKHLAMQFHIEIDEKKVNVWVSDEDDESWINSRKQYDSVQNKDEMLNDIPLYIEKHKQTADNIYTKWLSTTEWFELLKNR
jgi:hypothetical protein